MNKRRIVSHPTVMLGEPVVGGARIAAEHIVDGVAHGQSFEAPLKLHPTLTRDGVEATLDYAARVLRLDVVDSVEVG